MKKMLITCLAALFAVAAQAQDIMVVHPHEATPQQYEVANIDSMTWENATTLHIYFKDKTAQDFAIANVDSMTWLVVSEPEPGMTIGQVTLGVGEAFIINDSLTEARSTDCTVRFSPTVVEEDTKLVIRRATSAPPVTIDGLGVDETYDISEDAVAVDVSLGDLHKLNGMVEIRIPMGLRQGEVPGVAWYNEETNAWEPIEYEYDTKTGEVVVWSNHLSIIECYRIKGEHTNNARLEFYSVPFPDNSVDELLQMVNDAVSGTVEWADYISNWYGVFSTLGFDITWSALNAGGVESQLFEKTSEKIGNVGTLFAIYDILRAGFSGDDKTAGINTMKYLYSQVSSALSDAIGTSIMSAAMCSVAIIDYALNQLYEQMISDRRDLYLRSYQKYYSRNTSDGLKHHYRSAPEWYRLLLPAFKKGSPTIEAVNNEVDQIVDDYVNEYWNLSDDDQILYWLEIGGPQWSYSGGLNNDLKKELADNHKAELYRDVFPRVFDAIGREMRTESYNILYDSMKDYAKLMNQVIRLELAGQAATEGTSWEGCKVRFKELPATITDPANWESKLSAEGKGSIRFRFFAYTSEGVKPTLELVDYNGNIVREIPITICEGVSKISLGAAPATPYLTIDKESVSFVASEGTKSIEVKTNMTTIDVSSSVTWIKAEYDADSKTLSIKAEANTKASDREGIVTITGYYPYGSIERKIKVKQEKMEPDNDEPEQWKNFLRYNYFSFTFFPKYSDATLGMLSNPGRVEFGKALSPDDDSYTVTIDNEFINIEIERKSESGKLAENISCKINKKKNLMSLSYTRNSTSTYVNSYYTDTRVEHCHCKLDSVPLTGYSVYDATIRTDCKSILLFNINKKTLPLLKEFSASSSSQLWFYNYETEKYDVFGHDENVNITLEDISSLDDGSLMFYENIDDGSSARKEANPM